MIDSPIDELLPVLASTLLARGWYVSTAESCTGGGVAAALTSLAGSSRWFESGFITYSNRIKTRQLGVDPQLLERHGAVSEPVVRQMAEAARRESGAQLSVAVSGIAGPDGGSEDKPVGSVWFGWAVEGGETRCDLQFFHGDRAGVRREAVIHAIRGLVDALTTV